MFFVFKISVDVFVYIFIVLVVRPLAFCCMSVHLLLHADMCLDGLWTSKRSRMLYSKHNGVCIMYTYLYIIRLYYFLK